MARISGLSRPTVYTGVHELDDPPDPHGRVRRPGGGPKRLTKRQPGLLSALDALVDPDTRGDPESPLRWTCKSTRELADALGAQGFQVSDDTVGRLLRLQRYTLQRTQKTEEGTQHPDRDAQFATSTTPPVPGSTRACRWSASTPRTRSWSVTTPTVGWSGSRPASLSRCWCTTSPIPRSQGDPLRSLRPGRRHRLGECGLRP
jgi:hypothetical protein